MATPLLATNGRGVAAYKIASRTGTLHFDYDRMLVCTKCTMCLGGRSERAMHCRLDCDRPFHPTHLSVFRNALDARLGLTPSSNSNVRSVSMLKELYLRSSGRLRAYGQRSVLSRLQWSTKRLSFILIISLLLLYRMKLLDTHCILVSITYLSVPILHVLSKALA